MRQFGNLLLLLLIGFSNLKEYQCSSILEDALDDIKEDIIKEYKEFVQEELAQRDAIIAKLTDTQNDNLIMIQDLQAQIDKLKLLNNRQNNDFDNVHQDIDTLETQYLKLEKISKMTAVADSCAELSKFGINVSDVYKIDPDGKGVNDLPIEVFCDLENDQSLIGQRFSIDVDQCGSIGCFSHSIDYNLPMGQIQAAIDSSPECKQEILFECISSPLKV